MEKINESILKALKEFEKQSEAVVSESLKKTKSTVFPEFYNIWKRHDRDEYVNRMFEEMKLNITKFWLNEKYNKFIDKSFNMMYFEHGGLYGGELESFAVDFDYLESKLPEFQIMDKRFEYLNNISCFPACTVPILYDLTLKIQGKEKKFDDWSEVMDVYALFEATALVEVHEVLRRIDEDNLLNRLSLKKPFYLTVGEHDSGAPKLIYVIE